MMLKHIATVYLRQALVLSILLLILVSNEARTVRWTKRAKHRHHHSTGESHSDSSFRSTSKRHVKVVTIPSCEDPGIPENGIRFGRNLQAGAMVEFACRSGYLLRGASVLMCMWNEQNELDWDGDTPQCVGELQGWLWFA